MKAWIENLYSGIVGRFLRASLTMSLGLIAAHYKDNQWYIAAGPLLQMIGKTLRDKYPGKFEWLPI
jgi:hypothetical protein